MTNLSDDFQVECELSFQFVNLIDCFFSVHAATLRCTSSCGSDSGAHEMPRFPVETDGVI